MTHGDRVVERLSDAILWAREAPEFLERYGLPVPTRARCRRAFRGYTVRHQEFPASYRQYDSLATVLGVDRVCVDRSFFRFAEDGELAEQLVIQPVVEGVEEGRPEIVDLLAWHPARPERWWMHQGLAQYLGTWPSHGEVRLVEHPMAWLNAVDGLCLLTFDRETLTRLLDLQRITVADRGFGTSLYNELRDIALPQFEVARS